MFEGMIMRAKPAKAVKVTPFTTGVSQSKYRPEIDGLRAFAVVAVIINHFNKDLLPSGYLGVDIFFVISGYVITSSLADRKSKNFRDFLTGFYERRIKRILPALLVFVLITSVLISVFNPVPGVALGLGWRSLFGISNINLYQASTDYFSESTELNPFTHTWSLGVEEQFYLLFPFLIWFSGFGQQKLKGARNLFFLAGILSIASLINFIYLYPVNQPAAYFLMPSRFWEMAAGCLTFIAYQKRAKVKKTLELVPPLLVVVLMIGVMFLPSQAAVSATISIVALTVVLIACLKTGTATFGFFTHERVVYIGLISFSLYLWHWTVLSISHWTIGIHWWSVPLQVGIMIMMAIASYKWVETPLRRRTWFPQRWLTIVGGIVVTILSACILLIVAKLPENYLFAGDKKILNENFEDRFKKGIVTINSCLYANEPFKALSHCVEKVKNQESKRTIWLVGDSHAFTLLNGIRGLAKRDKSDLRVVTRRATAFPQPVNFVKKRIKNIEEDIVSINFMNKAKETIMEQIKPGDILIISLRFPFHFGPDTHEYKENDFIYQTSGYVPVKGNKQKYFANWLIELEKLAIMLRSKEAYLIVLGPVPEWDSAQILCVPQWFRLTKSDCMSPTGEQKSLNQKTISSLENLSQRQLNFWYVDIINEICNEKYCGLADQEGNILYFDDDHVSDYAAIKYVAPAIENVIKTFIDNQRKTHKSGKKVSGSISQSKF